MRAIISLSVAGALFTAVAVAQSQPQPSTKTANIDAAIKAVADQYVKATLAADAKAIAALYTDDAVEMPPNQSPVKGRAAIQQYYEKQFGAGKISNFQLEHLDTRSTGDIGYDVGTYRQSMTPSGGLGIEDTGKYIVILKRAGGVWKVAYAIYNSNTPLPSGSR